MSPSLQTVVALGVVALAAALLLRAWFGRKKPPPGCGGDCGAVNPEVRDLRRRLRR